MPLSAAIAPRPPRRADFTNVERLATKLAMFANMGCGQLLVGVADNGTISGCIGVNTGADKRQVSAREEMPCMFQQSGLLHADEQTVASASLSNIAPAEFAKYVELRYQKPVASTSMPFEQLLQNLNLTHDGKPNLAGMMLFDSVPHIKFLDERNANQFHAILKRPEVQTDGVNDKTPEKVFSALQADPESTIAELATQVGVTTRTIERALTKLQQENRVARPPLPAQQLTWLPIILGRALAVRMKTFRDGLAGNVADGMLVRASTVIDNGNDPSTAYQTQEILLAQLVEALSTQKQKPVSLPK